MAFSFQITVSQSPIRKAMVVSHERSGTHFLMNALALNFGYVVEPWLNFDFECGLNFHAPRSIRKFFEEMHDQNILNIVKSHHAAGFFTEIATYLSDQFFLFYIYRDPRDVLVSFWRFLHQLAWDEGPRVETASEFLRTPPRGGLMRYQKQQFPTMLHRWCAHVEGWLALAESLGPGKVKLVCFRDLRGSFEETIADLGTWMHRSSSAIRRPRPGRNVVVPGPGKVGRHRDHLSERDLEFVREIAGPTMEKLGFAP